MNHKVAVPEMKHVLADPANSCFKSHHHHRHHHHSCHFMQLFAVERGLGLPR